MKRHRLKKIHESEIKMMFLQAMASREATGSQSVQLSSPYLEGTNPAETWRVDVCPPELSHNAFLLFLPNCWLYYVMATPENQHKRMALNGGCGGEGDV